MLHEIGFFLSMIALLAAPVAIPLFLGAAWGLLVDVVEIFLPDSAD